MRTVFHTSKSFLQSPFSQPPSLFPYLNSQIVQSYSKQIIKFRKVHAICNINNVNQVVPLGQPCKEFVFFGRSNVGKSTLVNRLMQADVVEVSKRPGKTKELLFCQVGSERISDQKMVGGKIYFVDAPGYGFATGVSKTQISKWGKLITTYLQRTKQTSQNQHILCLVDITHQLKQTDALIFQLLKQNHKNFMIVFTKCDKFNFTQDSDEVKRALETAAMVQAKYQQMNFYVHFTSARTNLGVDQLRQHLMFQVVSGKV